MNLKIISHNSKDGVHLIPIVVHPLTLSDYDILGLWYFTFVWMSKFKQRYNHLWIVETKGRNFKSSKYQLGGFWKIAGCGKDGSGNGVQVSSR